jgi:hypothetical protein
MRVIRWMGLAAGFAVVQRRAGVGTERSAGYREVEAIN